MAESELLPDDAVFDEFITIPSSPSSPNVSTPGYPTPRSTPRSLAESFQTSPRGEYISTTVENNISGYDAQPNSPTLLLQGLGYGTFQQVFPYQTTETSNVAPHLWQVTHHHTQPGSTFSLESSGFTVPTYPNTLASRSLLDDSLPVHDVNEQPWSQYDIAPRASSPLAVPLSPLHQRSIQKRSSRVLDRGSIVRPHPPRSIRPRQASNIRTSASLSSNSPPSTSAVAQTSSRSGFGGRVNPLNDQQKASARDMRNTSACWNCALQRVTCSMGSICQKCVERLASSRGRIHPLQCDRTALPDMIEQFLPPRMTDIHDHRVVKLFVDKSVFDWLHEGGTRETYVGLTVGYGPTLFWPMHEFIPRNPDVILQLQWVTGPDGVRTCIQKRSPPLAIKRLDQGDCNRFVEFVDCVIDDHLEAFEETYYGDQDDDPFRQSMLTILCDLYRESCGDPNDTILRDDLKMAFRAIITTDIMLHHVTLEQNSKDAVISQLSNYYNDPQAYGTFVSPKLVNRQLKAFFSYLQKLFLERLLDRFHKILRMTKGQQREQTRLSSFVIMLTMAVCQEDMQHTRYLRADGESKRNEQSAESANEQAHKDCQCADRALDFLITLFNCKYSPPKKYFAHISDWISKPYDHIEHRFLRAITRLGQQNRIYLLTRKGWEVTSAYDNRYKSRLVARFLVGFMDLGNPT